MIRLLHHDREEGHPTDGLAASLRLARCGGCHARERGIIRRGRAGGVHTRRRNRHMTGITRRRPVPSERGWADLSARVEGIAGLASSRNVILLRSRRRTLPTRGHVWPTHPGDVSLQKKLEDKKRDAFLWALQAIWVGAGRVGTGARAAHPNSRLRQLECEKNQNLGGARSSSKRRSLPYLTKGKSGKLPKEENYETTRGVKKGESSQRGHV